MLKFVDNNRAMMLSGDPTIDPGFDEYDIVDKEEITEMTLKEFNELRKKYSIYDDIDDVLDFVSELLHRRAREIEKNEPSAWRTIEFLDKAAYEVWDLIDYINELEEN